MSIFRSSRSYGYNSSINSNGLTWKIGLFSFILGLIGAVVLPYFNIPVLEELLPICFWLAFACLVIQIILWITKDTSSMVVKIGTWSLGAGILLYGLSSVNLNDIPILNDQTLLEMLYTGCFGLSIVCLIIKIFLLIFKR